jgi:hypothetical protein
MRANARSGYATSRWLLAAVLVAFTAHAGQRLLRVDDPLRIETIGDTVTASPDGSWVAYVRQRPRGSAHTIYPEWELGSNERSDVWLAPLNGDTVPVRITDGERDGSGSGSRSGPRTERAWQCFRREAATRFESGSGSARPAPCECLASVM